MVTVSVVGDRVRFEVEGMDKLWAFKSQLEIPLEHIVSVRGDPHAAEGWFHGLRIPGTEIPGIITAGSFYSRDGAVFFDVHRPDKAIVVELNHEHYKRLVVEVDDPEATVEMLAAAVDAGRLARMKEGI
jgi:hypothetical protein